MVERAKILFPLSQIGAVTEDQRGVPRPMREMQSWCKGTNFFELCTCNGELCEM
jgi:hypothetical protein